MNSDHRQARRQSDFIPVSVTVMNNLTGQRAAGPLGGRIINISRDGACLLLPAANPEIAEMPGPLDARDCPLLEIKGALPGKETTFTLTARPVWSAPLILDDLRGRRMGVVFLDSDSGAGAACLCPCPF